MKGIADHLKRPSGCWNARRKRFARSSRRNREAQGTSRCERRNGRSTDRSLPANASYPLQSRHVAASQPGDLLSLDTFYVGKLKGVGKVCRSPRVMSRRRLAGRA